jgi:hypothetical protein
MIVRIVSLEMGKNLTTLSYYVWLKELTIVCVLEVLGSKSEHITFFCMDFGEPSEGGEVIIGWHGDEDEVVDVGNEDGKVVGNKCFVFYNLLPCNQFHSHMC